MQITQSDRKQINGCLGIKEHGEGQMGEITKSDKETFGLTNMLTISIVVMVSLNETMNF